MTVLHDDTANTATRHHEGSAAPPAASRDEEDPFSTAENMVEETNSPVNTADLVEETSLQVHTSISQQQDEEDDDEMTIIGLDQDLDEDMDHRRAAALAWMEQNGPEMEERRLNVLLRELHRAQRASFIHFILLCMIPTALMCIVVATVLGEEEPCGSDVTICRQEARTFVNAFTTRCICDAIDVNREG